MHVLAGFVTTFGWPNLRNRQVVACFLSAYKGSLVELGILVGSGTRQESMGCGFFQNEGP